MHFEYWVKQLFDRWGMICVIALLLVVALSNFLVQQTFSHKISKIHQQNVQLEERKIQSKKRVQLLKINYHDIPRLTMVKWYQTLVKKLQQCELRLLEWKPHRCSCNNDGCFLPIELSTVGQFSGFVNFLQQTKKTEGLICDEVDIQKKQQYLSLMLRYEIYMGDTCA